MTDIKRTILEILRTSTTRSQAADALVAYITYLKINNGLEVALTEQKELKPDPANLFTLENQLNYAI